MDRRAFLKTGVGLAGFYEWIKIKLHKYYKDED